MIHTLQRHDVPENTLLTTIREYLSDVYCPADGWKIFNRFRWSTAIPEMIIQKEGKTGYERIIVGVGLDKGVCRLSYAEIEKLTSRLQHDTVGQPRRILVVENMSATEGLPADIEVLCLQDLLQHKIRATEPKLVA